MAKVQFSIGVCAYGKDNKYRQAWTSALDPSIAVGSCLQLCGHHVKHQGQQYKMFQGLGNVGNREQSQSDS